MIPHRLRRLFSGVPSVFAALAIMSAALCAAAPAQAQSTMPADPKRIALLIGNEGYQWSNGELLHPHEDVDTLAAALGYSSFNVRVIKDASRSAMIAAIARFEADLAAQGPEAVGFFYFSGHGGRSSAAPGDDLLVPVDVDLTTPDSFAASSTSVAALVARLAQVGAKAVFVVADACRNEVQLRSMGSRSNSRATLSDGFSGVASRNGVLVAYSTVPGQTAPDDGAFGRLLADAMMSNGRDHSVAFAELRRQVARRRQSDQLPFYDDRLLEPICFFNCADQVARMQEQAMATAEQSHWRRCCESPSATQQELEMYLQLVERGALAGRYRGEAEQRLAAMRQSAARENAAMSAETERLAAQAFAQVSRLASAMAQAGARLDGKAEREAWDQQSRDWSRRMQEAQRNWDADAWTQRNPIPAAELPTAPAGATDREVRAAAQQRTNLERTRAQAVRNEISQAESQIRRNFSEISQLMNRYQQPDFAGCVAQIERAWASAQQTFAGVRRHGLSIEFDAPEPNAAMMCTPRERNWSEQTPRQALQRMCTLVMTSKTERECELDVSAGLAAADVGAVPATQLRSAPAMNISPLVAWMPEGYDTERRTSIWPDWANQRLQASMTLSNYHFHLTTAGGVYYGPVSREKRDGCGLELFADGALMYGCFVADRLHGVAAVAAPRRGYFRGEWRDGSFVRRLPIAVQ